MIKRKVKLMNLAIKKTLKEKLAIVNEKITKKKKLTTDDLLVLQSN